MPYKDPQRQQQSKNEAARRQRERRIQEHYAGKACVRCDYDEWRILEYHHRDPATKCFTVGSGLGTRSEKALLEEIKKCDLLCPNCHALTHISSAGDDVGESCEAVTLVALPE